MTRPALLDESALREWLAAHPAWHVVTNQLVATYEIGFTRAVEVAASLLSTINEMDHHPQLTIEYAGLRVEVSTHDRGGITSLDTTLATAFDAQVASDN